MGEFLSVGYGNVGQAVPERCTDLGLEQSDFVIKSDGTYSRQADGTLELYSGDPDFWNDERVVGDVEAAFVTIPSGEAQRELDVIEGLQERGVTVVTAAKGALANYFAELEPRIDQTGISATAGGGTRMIPHLLDRLNPRVTQVHVVPNGTINHILHGIDEGETPGQMIEQAVVLGYAEPGASIHLDVLNGEIVGDVPKKATILYNAGIRRALGLERIVVPEDIEAEPLTFETYEQLVAEAGDRRYILSFLRGDHAQKEENNVLAGFRTGEIEEGWAVVGGFRRIGSNPLFKRHLRVPGAWNAILTAEGPDESDGVFSLTGPGAGPGPTAASMVQDARHLLRVRRQAEAI